MRKWHFISGSTVNRNTYLLFCHFPRSGWPRGSCTIPSVVGKRLQLISHASPVQVTLFFSTSALVNNLLGSRATVGHSSSLLSQRKHRSCFRFSLFLSAFPTVFFKTTCSIPSNIYQFLQDFAIVFFYFYVDIFHLTYASFFPYNCFQFFLHQPFYFSSTLVSRDLISSQFIFFSLAFSSWLSLKNIGLPQGCFSLDGRRNILERTSVRKDKIVWFIFNCVWWKKVWWSV